MNASSLFSIIVLLLAFELFPQDIKLALRKNMVAAENLLNIFMTYTLIGLCAKLIFKHGDTKVYFAFIGI